MRCADGRALSLDGAVLLRDALTTPGAGLSLDAFDPRARLLCALAVAVAVSSLSSLPALLCASIVPLGLLLCGPVVPLLRSLLRLNVVGFVMALLLALTCPGPDLWGLSREGLRLGALIIVRLNLISVTLLRLAAAMGPGRLNAAMSGLHVPEKLRVLLLLTLRGILLLVERTESALRALHLRAPGLRGALRLRAFACVAASSLVQGADRSERVMMALRCRGGLGGFAQGPERHWRLRDTALCLAFALDILAAGML